MEQKSSLRENYLLNGYLVIKSIFNKEYISKLRKRIIDLSYKDMEKYEILLDEDIQNILLNKKLITTIKEILDCNNILYYSDSSIVNHVNPFKNRNGFHNDARGEDQNKPYEQEYPILRVGIYFEDYKNYSGGLKIKKNHINILFLILGEYWQML